MNECNWIKIWLCVLAGIFIHNGEYYDLFTSCKKNLTCTNTHFLFSYMWEFIMVKSKNILKAKNINILVLLVWFSIRIFSNPIIYLFIYLFNALIWNIINFWWLIIFFQNNLFDKYINILTLCQLIGSH